MSDNHVRANGEEGARLAMASLRVVEEWVRGRGVGPNSTLVRDIETVRRFIRVADRYNEAERAIWDAAYALQAAVTEGKDANEAFRAAYTILFGYLYPGSSASPLPSSSGGEPANG